jgi:hypothetical protein
MPGRSKSEQRLRGLSVSPLTLCPPPPALAVPTPDAIIASVSFTDCTIAPDSYEINDTYRPVTREEGFIVLRDVWLEALKARLAKST